MYAQSWSPHISGRAIIASDVGLVVMLSLLVSFGYAYGFRSVMYYYFIPYMVRPHTFNTVYNITHVHHSSATIGDYFFESPQMMMLTSVLLLPPI